MTYVDDVTSPLVPWWEEDEDFKGLSKEQIEEKRAQHLVAETAAIEQRQRSLHELNLWNATLYSNRQLQGFFWGANQMAQESAWTPSNLVTENLVLSIGDAMLSRAATSPTRVVPTPRGADFSVYQLVRKLDRWLSGMWRDLNIEDLHLQLFLDAFIAGHSVLRYDWDPEKKKICAERVFFDNLVVDNTECTNTAEPRTVRIRQIVPVASVCERYGVEFSKEELARGYTNYRAVGEGWVPVVEAWRKGPEGRHTVACCGKVLLDEEWNEDWVPLVMFFWSPWQAGFYRASGVEQVVPYQIRLNEINEVIRDAQDLMARPRILVHTGSAVDVNAIDNVIGRIIKYTGVKPEAMTWDAISGELYNERDRLVRSCFEFFGMSQMTAQAQLPSGVRLDSSAAVREFRVQEDQRFLHLWRRFEKLRIDSARTLIRVMTRYQGTAKTYWSNGRGFGEEIDWGEVKDLEENCYTWSLEPTSLTSQTPAARMDTLNTWVANNWITPERAGTLSGNPDLEGVMAMETATVDDIKAVVESLEAGEYEPPDPTQNLVFGIPFVTSNLARLRRMTASDPAALAVAKDNHVRWLRAALAITNPVTDAEEGAMSPLPPDPMPMGLGTGPVPPGMGAMMPMPGVQQRMDIPAPSPMPVQ